MRLLYSKFYKINNIESNSQEENFQADRDIDVYVQELISDCTSKGDREYKFDNTRLTTKSKISDIVLDEERSENSCFLANKLAKVEHDTNEQYPNLKSKIPIGILLVAYVDLETDDNDRYFVLAKADYTEFIEETSGLKKSGLPTKRKIFKSFVAKVDVNENQVNYSHLMTFDPQKTSAVYWWNGFLELSEVRSDRENTMNVLKLLKKQILNPIKNSYKEAYLPIYNATMTYLTTAGNFDLDYYKDSIFGGQVIGTASFKMVEWKKKIEKLPEQGEGFDKIFTKQVDAITDKNSSTEISLTPLIGLKIKNNFAGIDSIIKPMEDHGDKGIFIKSDDGWEYAKGLIHE